MKLFRIILILNVYCLLSCSKDHIADCENLPHSPAQGWDINEILPYYKFPNFNPNNPNELLYEVHESAGVYKLFKYNLTTTQKQLVYTGENLFQPKWGKNDWILLNPDANIWKIKSNGDSLTQITFTNGDFAPEWNLTSDSICFYRSIGVFQKTIIADINGNALDTLDQFTSQCSWQNPNMIVTATGGSLFVIDVMSRQKTILLTQQEPSLNSACWLNDNNKIIYSAENGIFCYEMSANKSSNLISHCNTKYYQFPTYSAAINKLIWQRVDLTPNSTTLKVQSRLFMMNPDGTGETEIMIQ